MTTRPVPVGSRLRLWKSILPAEKKEIVGQVKDGVSPEDVARRYQVHVARVIGAVVKDFPKSDVEITDALVRGAPLDDSFIETLPAAPDEGFTRGMKAILNSTGMRDAKWRIVTVDGELLMLTIKGATPGSKSYALYDGAGQLQAISPAAEGYEKYPTLMFHGDPGSPTVGISLV